MIPNDLSRRSLIAATIGAIAVPAWAFPAATPGRGVRPALMEAALGALFRHSSRVTSHDMIAVVDFALPSSAPRFHLVDLLGGTTTSLLCAHGKGSDPEHIGMLQRFLNIEGSLGSSEGAYLTGESYVGRNGLSRRLDGLEPTNDQARPRLIVIHGAAYSTTRFVAEHGIAGRSDGCFAVPADDIATLLMRFREGRLLFAGR